MPSKNYKWQKEWTVDLDRCTAKHKDGLLFNVDEDQNGELECSIELKGESWNYYTMKRESLSKDQFEEHLGKLQRQAKEIFKAKYK